MSGAWELLLAEGCQVSLGQEEPGKGERGLGVR